MPEVRVTITEKMNKLLDEVVKTGLFTSKADLFRFAVIAFLKDLGLIKELSEKLSERKRE